MERSELLAHLASAPERIATAARRAAAADEKAGGPPAGEWSAREAVGHLVNVETLVWHARLDSLDAGGTPSWPWTEPGPAGDPATETLEGALTRFATLRAETVARVGRLDDAGWARAGIHKTFGRLDVAAMLLVAVEHDDEHVDGLTTRTPG